VVENSQGAKSGIQIGDKLVGVNGEPIPGDLSGGSIRNACF
jgi:S1-C subfamily serine protease